MLKFIKHHMTSIDGISIYPLISLVIFSVFFAALIIYTMRLDKSFVKMMKDQPLGDETKNLD